MVAAAGAGVAAVEHEFFRAQPGLAGFRVERGRVRDQFIPILRGMKVDLDHAGIGRDVDLIQPVIMRGRVAFQDDRLV